MAGTAHELFPYGAGGVRPRRTRTPSNVPVGRPAARACSTRRPSPRSSSTARPTQARFEDTHETRAALRAAAARLFLERGPAAVTVSDICEAAGVSARTFFNYFDAKEDALLPGDKHLIEEIITGLAARPAAEPPLTAVRQAFEQALPALTAFTGWQVGDRVLTAYPELRPTVVHGMIRNQARLADALAERAGQARGSLYPELLAGAAASAFRAAFSVWAPETGNAGLQALVGEAFDRLAAGLPPEPA